MSENNFILKESLSIRENIEIFKKHKRLSIDIDFPQIPTDAISKLANQRNISKILDSINFTYISNFFSAVKIYLTSAYLSQKDLRDIKKDKGTLYLFLAAASIHNNRIIFEYISDDYEILSPNIIYFDTLQFQTTHRVAQETAIDKLLELTCDNKVEQHLTAVKVNSIKDKLIKQFNENKQTQIEQLKSRAHLAATTIQDLQTRLDAKVKEKLRIENEMAAVAATEFQYSKYVDSLNKIIKIRGIVDVDVADISVIDLYTDKLYINSMGYRFYVGKFRINVDMNNNSVHIYNLDSTCLRKSYWGADCQHPHVSNTGNPCLGEAASGVVDACKNKRPDIIAIILVNYLESINPNDAAGKYLTNWDVVDENGEVTDFPEECNPCNICGDFVTESNKHKFHICHTCGHNHCEDCMSQAPLTNNANETESVWVCNECVDAIQYCSSCGKIMADSYECSSCGETVCRECINLIGGRQYCTECMKNYTTACIHCGQLTLNENHICDECEEHICTFCHSISDKLVEIDSHTKLCAKCFRDTGVCIYCGERKPIEELIVNESAGITYCKNGCHEEQTERTDEE